MSNQPISVVNEEQQVEYRTIERFPGYRFGEDGGVKEVHGIGSNEMVRNGVKK